MMSQVTRSYEEAERLADEAAMRSDPPQAFSIVEDFLTDELLVMDHHAALDYETRDEDRYGIQYTAGHYEGDPILPAQAAAPLQ